MVDFLKPELKSLLKEVVSFLGQLGDTTISTSLRTTADDLKLRIEDLCFEKSDIVAEGEELYDEATRDEDLVPELPSARPGNSAALISPKDEMQITEVSATSFVNPIQAGYLEKKRPDSNKFIKSIAPYQRRYCVIQDGIFYYFETATSKKQSGAFHLKEYEARTAYHLIKSVTRKEGSFEMVSPGQRSFQFLAKNFDEMKDWISAVGDCSDVEHPPISTLARPSDAVDKNSGMSSGSDSGSINVSAGPDCIEEQSDYVDAETDPGLKSAGRKSSPLALSKKPLPVPVPEELYDDAQEEQATYDEAKPEPGQETYDEVEQDIYDEAGIEEETYDEAGEAAAPPPVKAMPKLPSGPMSKRAVPPPPVPDVPKARALPTPPSPTPQPKTIQVNSEDYENMFYGLWDCETEVSHELSFSSGDVIHVVDREHEAKGWWTGLLNGKIGLVPKSYLTAAYVAC